MNTFFAYLKRTFVLQIKEVIIYPASLWSVIVTAPLYALSQIIFLETIYSQTSNFAGFTKYQAYILFGTFMMVQSLGYIFLYSRLIKLKALIRGEGQESFEMALTKPIDAQIFATLGRYSLGSIAPFFVTLSIVVYGMTYEFQAWNMSGVIQYVFIVCMGVFINYLLFLFISTFLFWFPELQVVEAIWESLAGFGQYPSALYRGAAGVLFNLIIPVTLMASIPVEFLFGRKPWYMFFVYLAIVAALFLLVRLFWNWAIKEYSGSGS